MTRIVDKTPDERYWVAYGSDGTMFTGVKLPDQVVHTGQPNLAESADPEHFAGLVAASGATVQPMPPEGEDVTRGSVYKFEGTVYVCVQDHTRTEFPPDQTPALFTPARQQASPWVQPTGAQDAYKKGDVVTHDNPNDGGTIWLYRSSIDANTAEPGRDGTADRFWEPIRQAKHAEPGGK